jgi:glyoxylase-like metal-dependent hydrolase (beta-lactamase superfamily II)
MVRFYPIKMKMPTFDQDAPRSIPLMAGVLRFPDFLVIVDTGYDKELDLELGLSRLHFAPTDFDFVLNTHVHPDHVGNNRLFTRARVIVSRVDYEFARAYCHAMIDTNDPFLILKAYYPESRGVRLERFSRQAQLLAQRYWQDDVLGREDQIQWIEDHPELPSQLKLVPTPGHTPGHYAVLLATNPALLLCADAMAGRIFYKSKLKEHVPRFNSEQFLAGKAYIEQFSGLIMGGHDRPFWSATGHYCDDDEVLLF